MPHFCHYIKKSVYIYIGNTVSLFSLVYISTHVNLKFESFSDKRESIMWSGSKIVSVPYTKRLWLPCEWSKMKKDKNWVKDKKSNHLFSWSLSFFFLLAKEVPLQSVFHSTYQPTNKHNIPISHIHILSKPHNHHHHHLPFPPHEAFSLSLKTIIHLYSFLLDLHHNPLHKALKPFTHPSHPFITPFCQMRKPDMMPKDKLNTTTTTINTTTNNNNIKTKLRKGLWSPEEDEKLIRYMITKGQGCWSDIARNAGLQRCGKSCRLRWINYLRPDLKRGAFSPQEEELIIHLHSLLGNRYQLHSLHCINANFLNYTSKFLPFLK